MNSKTDSQTHPSWNDTTCRWCGALIRYEHVFGYYRDERGDARCQKAPSQHWQSHTHDASPGQSQESL